MKRLPWFIACLILPWTLVAQNPPVTAVPTEKVQITVGGEVLSKTMPSTIPELKELVRWLANKVNELNADGELERKEFSAKLEASSQRYDEILTNIKAMDDANQKIVDSVGKIQDIQDQITGLAEQLKKKPYGLFIIAQPGLSIGPSVGYGGGFTIGTVLYGFGLLGINTHVYTSGTFDLGISLGISF